MADSSSFLMQSGCPWVDLRQATGVPDIVWCEKQVCAWIATPSNAWSNFAYFSAALFLFVVARKEKAAPLRFYPMAAFWVGLTSFAYHASLTYATQILDFFGMYLFLFLILTQSFARLGRLDDRKILSATWGATLLCTAASAAAAKMGIQLQPLVLVLILAILFTEWRASRISKRPLRYRDFSLSLIALGVGAFFSAADVSHRICDPESPFQGHALWHVLGAVAMVFSYRHARQFYFRAEGFASSRTACR